MTGRASSRLLLDLPERDLAVLADLRRVRLMTGAQVERTNFYNIQTQEAQSSARRRTLNRLAAHKLVTTLPRRIGGERSGSAGLVYLLDAAGHRLFDELEGQRIRRPWPIGLPFVHHTLAVSELYVRLREQERSQHINLVEFLAEPAAWHRGVRGVIKPDAYVSYLSGEWEQHLWVELDRGTESLPALERKLQTYLDEVRVGGSGPDGILPRVLISVDAPERRVSGIARLIGSLPAPAAQLFELVSFADTFRSVERPPP